MHKQSKEWRRLTSASLPVASVHPFSLPSTATTILFLCLISILLAPPSSLSSLPPNPEQPMAPPPSSPFQQPPPVQLQAALACLLLICAMGTTSCSGSGAQSGVKLASDGFDTTFVVDPAKLNPVGGGLCLVNGGAPVVQGQDLTFKSQADAAQAGGPASRAAARRSSATQARPARRPPRAGGREREGAGGWEIEARGRGRARWRAGAAR